MLADAAPPKRTHKVAAGTTAHLISLSDPNLWFLGFLKEDGVQCILDSGNCKGMDVVMNTVVLLVSMLGHFLLMAVQRFHIRAVC
jgi:hypothetical protein